MRKVPVLLLLIMCFLLIGCKEPETIHHNYKFYGEGTHWEATLHFIGKGSSSSHYDERQKEFLLEYKGEYSEISNSIVNYSYKASSGNERGSESPPGTTYIRTNEEGTGGDIQRKDEVIKVIVKWNGKEEIIPMKIQNDK